MTEYHVMYWRELPSMVVARDGARVAKLCLPDRFAEAIDAAAEHVSVDDSNAALAGWRRTRWSERDGKPTSVVHAVVDELTEQWPSERVDAYLEAMDVDLDQAS